MKNEELKQSASVLSEETGNTGSTAQSEPASAAVSGPADGKKERILEVENLHVSFNTYAGEVKAVRGVSFELSRGETLAFVGESGCGKSVTSKAVMRLLKPPFAEIKPESKIICDGKDVMKMSKKELYSFRGDEISMIFQDPMTSTPVLPSAYTFGSR